MKIERGIPQGSNEWLEYRKNHYNASEAGIMLGLSRHMKRSEFVKLKATKTEKEYTDYVRNVVFKSGHDAEKHARSLMEDAIQDTLYPVTCSDGKYSASCDGLTMSGLIAFEHKLYNKDLFDYVMTHNTVPDEYMPQCQQILMVTGAMSLTFVCSDGTLDKMVSTTIDPDTEYFDRLRTGWELFHHDVDNFIDNGDIKKKDSEISLPDISVTAVAKISKSDLPIFIDSASAYLASIKHKPITDEDFVYAKNAVKFISKTEKSIEKVKESILEQCGELFDVIQSLDNIKDDFRRTRLYQDTLVKNREQNIKQSIIKEAIDGILSYLGQKYFDRTIPRSVLDMLEPGCFSDCVKNLKTIESYQNAVDCKAVEIKLDIDKIMNDNTEMPEHSQIVMDVLMKYTEGCHYNEDTCKRIAEGVYTGDLKL